MDRLKTIFIGSKGDFNEILVHWLSQRTEVVGVIWVHATAWQRSWRGRLEFARRRYLRYGLWKVVNETLFYFYYHRFLEKRDQKNLYQYLIHPYWEENGVPEWKGDAIFASDVNEKDVLAFMRERQPDVTFAMCINNYFGKDIRSIPRHGVLLWHEGITPEYKGLYSPFWAAHNLDFDGIGYTLLRMNDKLDAGEVFVQGCAKDIDPRHHGHGYMGHKAIIDSLPEVAEFLNNLEASEVEPLNRPGAKSGYYTYPGFTDYLRQQKRLRKLK